MASDYTKFRTPFYRISIGDSLGNNMVDLPHSLMRLVDKIDILESFETTTKIVVTFIEGSREPASPASMRGSNKLYKTTTSGSRSDIDLGANLTNKSGLLPDLKFSGSGGITFTTADDLNKNAGMGSAQGVLTSVNAGTSIRVNKTPQKAPKFLFQERNQIKVTWGYVEDPASVRSIRCQIIMTETEFPESGQPRTTITAQDSTAFLDQLALNKSVNFGQVITTRRGNNVIDFTDVKTDELLRDICTKAGIPFIISQDLPAPILDKGHFKIWIAGESFNEFLRRLADAHNCYYKVIPDPASGKDTLIFIKKTDFDAKPVVADPTLFAWKQPGTLLKSFNIRADFGMIGGNTEVTLDQEGNVLQKVSQDGPESVVLYQSATDTKSGSTQLQSLPDFDPTGNNPNQAALGIAKAYADQIADPSGPSGTKYVVSGKLENSPAPSNALLEDRTQFKAVDLARAISIDFSSIGFTRLIPGIIEIRNIGVRYSGKYRLITVSHVIDSNGYTCKATGTTYALSEGGTRVPALPGQNVEQQVGINLFQPQAETSITSTRDQLTAFTTKQ